MKDDEIWTKIDEEYDCKNNYSKVLNILANISLIIFIIVSICIFVQFSTTEVQVGYNIFTEKNVMKTEINWYGIIAGLSSLFSGIILFFTLKSIVNINKKVDEIIKKLDS